MDRAAIAALEAAWQHRVPVREPGEFWDWQPADLGVFARLLAAAVPHCPPGRTFCDVGCGIGTKCLLAEAAGIPAAGIDRVPEYLAEAARLGVAVTLADARTYRRYRSHGIVYVNHPLRDSAAEEVLERYIHAEMAPGAVLMAYNAGCFPPDTWREITADRPAWRGVWVKA